jgi:S-adenosylmethionine synthetase
MNPLNLFTSESVGNGHPDKVCDQISDAILDECFRQDPNSRVAVESLVTTNTVFIAGEVTTLAKFNAEAIARKVIKDIGYIHPEQQFDYQNANIIIRIHEQSPDISQGVTEVLGREQGAGDQGIMFGYASNETSELMPLAISLAHKLVIKAKEVREKDSNSFLYSDCKSQVTIDYSSSSPTIDTIVLSLNHKDSVEQDFLKDFAYKNIIVPVCGKYLSDNTKILVNPTGRFVVGGPHGDTGLTGRKIIVDSYGGYARHGGGAFSGKDPTKVDRSAAYALRWVAKNLVASGLCDKCEIQVSYAIGYPKPINVTIEFFGTEKEDSEKIVSAVNKVFDLSPKGIVDSLGLRKPIYLKTAFGGHFGRTSEGDFFPWERTDKVNELKSAISSF